MYTYIKLGGEDMLKKSIFLVLMIGSLYIFSIGAFAAPYTLDSSYRGTADIIQVTNPNDGVTTFKNHAVVSVTGNEGVIVTLYLYDPNVGQFVLYTQSDGGNSWFVGPSGLFVKRIPINVGVNYVGVFAELNGYDQFITRRVDRANQSIREELKSLLIQSMDDLVQ